MLSKNRLKYLQSLKQKKYRQKYGQFLVEGEKSVAELLHSDFIVDEIIADERFAEQNPEILEGRDVTLADGSQMQRLSSFSSSPPIAALANMPKSKHRISDDEWVLVLDGIKDPGNLGTIVRTADWYGIKSLVCSEDCVDFYNPKAISSTMGSFTRLQAQYTDLVSFLKGRKNPLACVLNGESIRKNGGFDSKTLIIGSESHGISQEVLDLTGILPVTIPGAGSTESLNAAIATAIALERLTVSVDEI